MQALYTLTFLQMNVGNFSKLENKSSYSHRDKRHLLTRRVSQINVHVLKRIFQQSSKLTSAICLKIHVLSSSFHVTRFQLGYEWKATEQRRLCVSKNILLYNVVVNHDWTDANNIVSKCWFMRTFPTQEYSQTFSHISSKSMSQVNSKNC